MGLQKTIGGQLKKRKELLYNLGAISSYASMLIFFWHGVSMLVAKEHPKHTLVVYAALTFFTIVVMAPYKWDKKWMRIKTSIGMLVFGVSLLIYCSAGLRIDLDCIGFDGLGPIETHRHALGRQIERLIGCTSQPSVVELLV